MQTIQTIYNGETGKYRAKSWNGWTSTEIDHTLNSEQNHRAAAEKLIAKLNQNKSVSWGIVASAPAVPGVRGADNGWTFIIGYMPEVAPVHMSIRVKFCPGTNTGPAFMRVYSWMFPRGVKVNYSRATPGGDTQESARQAARVMLEMINEKAKDHGVQYRMDQYIQLDNDDRVFSLKYL